MQHKQGEEPRCAGVSGLLWKWPVLQMGPCPSDLAIVGRHAVASGLTSETVTKPQTTTNEWDKEDK